MTFEELLIKRGITSGELAKRIGRDKSFVSRIKNGSLRIPKLIGPKIAKELGVDIAVLLECFPKKEEFEKVAIPRKYFESLERFKSPFDNNWKSTVVIQAVHEWLEIKKKEKDI